MIDGTAHITATVTCNDCEKSEQIVDQYAPEGTVPYDLAYNAITESDEWHHEDGEHICDNCHVGSNSRPLNVEVTPHARRSNECRAMAELLRSSVLPGPHSVYEVDLDAAGDVIVTKYHIAEEWGDAFHAGERIIWWSPDAELMKVRSGYGLDDLFSRARRADWTGRVRRGGVYV